ncbi:TBCC domain-containing protein 1 isoform X2 [Rhinoderma darwinii]|uniref:TBCC domain-containing protein 1 isoform X2 n=1 Tax=Rhinoderma darwinii TaxID=43563 RepID=UPI003F680397
MDDYKVQIWVKADPFLIGALQFPPPDKFNMHYLRKMATYVRTRSADGFYPRLSWAMWRHITCGKLQLVEDTAWLYYEAFHSLTERSAHKNLEWAECVSSCSSVDEYEKAKSKLSVDTLQFLLFLYIQQINKVSLRTSLIGDEWPSPRARTATPELAGLSNFHNKLLFDFERCLAYLLPEYPVDGSNRKAKIVCNIYKVPRGNHMVLMSYIHRQTLAKSSETLVGAHIKITHCNESFIYLLSPLRCVTIEKCRHSTIILGPVQTVLHVQMCDHVTVISACQRLSLLSTTNCTFHILTPTRPLLFSGNQCVVFAPFHTHYSMLEDHMGQTGLATLPNYWDRPQLLSTENDNQVWKLMSPREFYPFVIPFEMEGDTTEIPGGLPPVYQKSMDQRQQKVQMWQKAVKEAKLTREQRMHFQALVEQKFNEWLVKTGNRHQLDTIVPQSDGTKQVAGL